MFFSLVRQQYLVCLLSAIKKGRYKTGLFHLTLEHYIGLLTKAPFNAAIEITT